MNCGDARLTPGRCTVCGCNLQWPHSTRQRVSPRLGFCVRLDCSRFGLLQPGCPVPDYRPAAIERLTRLVV
jgi:hypothetical protein